MERMWQERADYGHFFYRIPDGESAADAYDRVSGFNESLWRQFGDDDFPSVCVLVTHGLMSRVFLMKWYHWSVEYFEDLRNVNHCEFILMNKDERGKYVLDNKLRTWSELKRQKREQAAREDPQRRNTLSHFLSKPKESPHIPVRQWGGCKQGCDHGNDRYPRRVQQTKNELSLPPPAAAAKGASNEAGDHAVAVVMPVTEDVGNGTANNTDTSSFPTHSPSHPKPSLPSYLLPGRDGGGDSGANTPHDMSEDEGQEYFAGGRGQHLAEAIRKAPQRKATPEDIDRWVRESGMNSHKRADPLGDEAASADDELSDDHLASPEQGAATMEDIEQAEKDDKGLRGSVY